jgi:hypothetical protein
MVWWRYGLCHLPSPLLALTLSLPLFPPLLSDAASVEHPSLMQLVVQTDPPQPREAVACLLVVYQ